MGIGHHLFGMAPNGAVSVAVTNVGGYHSKESCQDAATLAEVETAMPTSGLRGAFDYLGSF